MQTEKNESVRLIANVNPADSPGFDNCQLMNQELNTIRTSNDFNSFKYELFDLCCDYSIPIRDIPLVLHQSIKIIIISFHEITAY